MDALRQSMLRAQLAKPLPNGTHSRSEQSRSTPFNRPQTHPEARGSEMVAITARFAALDNKLDTLIDMLTGPANDRRIPHRLLPADIRRVVTTFFAVTDKELDGRSRSGSIARIRQIAFYLCRTRTAQSLPEIGRAFKRDHSTILHGVRRIAAARRTDAALHGDLSTLEARLVELLARRIAATPAIRS